MTNVIRYGCAETTRDYRASHWRPAERVRVLPMTTTAAAIDLFKRGKSREAELACQSRLAVAHQDTEALSLLADIHLSTGRTASALDLLKRLTDLRPRDAGARRRLGAALLSAGRPAEAAEALRAAVEIDPHSPRAHNNLGQALMQLGQWPDAVASCREALRL